MKKNLIKDIVELGRFRFLGGGFLLFCLGSLLAVIAGADFDIKLFLFGYAIMLPAHLGLSYSNNYFDVNVDKYNKAILISGGTKTLIEKPELRIFCKWFSIILIVTSLVMTIFFMIYFNFSITFFLFVLSGNLLGWFYTAPPLRLAYRGLGEIANMITMGVLMPGIGFWVIFGGFDLLFLLFSFPLILYGLDFIITVETPDMEGDKIAGKNTFVVKKGRKFGFNLIFLVLLLVTIYFIVLWSIGIYSEKINFLIVALMSLIPLAFSAKHLIDRSFGKIQATKAAIINMAT
ncbi:MAG: prenyltransferase, partial [Candidatus Thermoplasmatota archaeon]|nr:prenyltransferase [Candidatus Thermoplasmatota archaeon]